MINTMIKLLTVIGGLLLMSPLVFAGSEPNPGTGLVDGKPVIRRVSLSIVPSPTVCIDETNAYTGVDCVYGDITIVGRCKGIIVSAALREFPLQEFGLDADNEDITDISESGLEGRLLTELGQILADEVPGLASSRCQVVNEFGVGRNYEIRKVQKFSNDEGVISGVIELVPRD